MATILPEACPLTGQVAQVTSGDFDGWTVNGHYTDGSYRIASSVIDQVRSYSPTQRAKIVTWIVDEHRNDVLAPMVASHILQPIMLRRELTYDQKVQRFFLMLRRMNFRLGQSLRYSGIVDQGFYELAGRTSAWLEVIDQAEVPQVLASMVDENLLREQNNKFYLTANGLRRLDLLAASGAESDQAFVAMWFSASMDEVYEKGFHLGISDAGFRPLRIDKKEHANKIDDEIIAEIRRSRFVVADFTCELVDVDGRKISVPRGGVYYEAGFAQGLNIPVIWTVRADCIEHVHFDTRQYSHIVWADAEDLRKRLKDRIGAVIGTPNRQ